MERVVNKATTEQVSLNGATKNEFVTPYVNENNELVYALLETEDEEEVVVVRKADGTKASIKTEIIRILATQSGTDNGIVAKIASSKRKIDADKFTITREHAGEFKLEQFVDGLKFIDCFVMIRLKTLETQDVSTIVYDVTNDNTIEIKKGYLNRDAGDKIDIALEDNFQLDILIVSIV